MSPDAEVIVSARGAARWERGHPWIYKSDVTQRTDAPAGVVRVLDVRRRPIGRALWSPASEISLRLLDRDPDAVIDSDWWRARLSSALERRAWIGDSANACRLVHGEGDGLPSLVVDRYDRWLVVQLSSAGIERFRNEITAALVELVEPLGILARNDIPTRAREELGSEVELLHGSVPDDVTVREGHVHYLAAPYTGQKTGAFLDQRENRMLLGELARGRALDCFSYHGSFALHLARRAESVTAIDSSAAALERAHENARLNGTENIDFVEANVFDWLREAERSGERFDTIVLDPPAFARSRQALPGALRGYREINLRAMRLLAPGGLLFTASCSYHMSRTLFQEMLQDAASDSGRLLTLRALRGQSRDHPEVLTIPESGYLKGALLEAV